ncbi:DUF4817 domain-containing protein [Trichonephila clavipes]|nr:DUF4817 domain-containing protein [Trichonephila clavipes]
MVTRKEKAFCVLQFSKKESAITVQRAFRINFGCQPQNDNSILRWYHQFETTGCFCKGKSTGRPRLKLVTNGLRVPPLPADLSDIRHRMEADVVRIASDTLKKFGMNLPIDFICAV